ncbi:MAG: GNAT family N-acetyltransferase [Pseudomonadota bacterium]
MLKIIESFASRPGLPVNSPAWPHVFVHPRWMQTWWDVFGNGAKPHVVALEKDGAVVGVAPLSLKDATASFVGDPEICDYLDFWTVPGLETEFFQNLLEYLPGRGVGALDLRRLRPESPALSCLTAAAEKIGASVTLEPDGSSWELELPENWDLYLDSLAGKQRHELRRKLRRLDEAGRVDFTALEDVKAVSDGFDVFLAMFTDSRADKAAFMNPRMEAFFRSMFPAMAEEGLLKLFLLRLDGRPAAAAACFDYRGGLYLYNCGYDPQYGNLSVGFLCKVLSLKYAMTAGRKKYDFLTGDEPYKQRLGGREVRLTRCRLTF